jgi:hypothetical protein
LDGCFLARSRPVCSLCAQQVPMQHICGFLGRIRVVGVPLCGARRKDGLCASCFWLPPCHACLLAPSPRPRPAPVSSTSSVCLVLVIFPSIALALDGFLVVALLLHLTRSLFTGLFTPLFALPHPTAPIFDDEEWLWESGASFLLTHCSPHHSGPRHQPPTWLWLCDLCRRQGRCRCCQRSPQLGEKSLCSVYIAVLWVFGRSSLFLLTCASVCLPTTCSFCCFV